MKYSKIPLSQTVVALCKTHGIQHIVISPGSRNAPLTIGFTHNDYFRCYSIVDERCAGFFALGIAQQLQTPVALVCTSGSALLNYYPAVSEAFYSNIPLVVLSADRPPHLIDIGDGQTIKQDQVYGAHVVYSATLKLDKGVAWSNLDSNTPQKFAIKETQSAIQAFNEATIHSALSKAVLKLGPVHLNLPFDEPLYETTNVLAISPEPFAKVYPQDCVTDFEMQSFKKQWQSAKRKRRYHKYRLNRATSCGRAIYAEHDRSTRRTWTCTRCRII